MRCECCGREFLEEELEEFMGYYFCQECWSDKELEEYIFNKIIK